MNPEVPGPALGDPAPDFTLPSTAGSDVTLSSFRRQSNVDLLSDFKREASRRYGTLLEKEFFSRRAYFVVDREGLVHWSFVERELGSKRVNDELLAQLAALR